MGPETSLPKRQFGGRNLCILLFGIVLAGCATWPTPHASRAQARVAANVATRLRGVRYHYGGDRLATGFDCSGLIHYSYARAGVALPRTARSLSRLGRPVSDRHLARGDLLFFYERGLPYGHVGLYIGHNRFIHAPSPGQRVREDSLHSTYWRRHLAGVRRLW